MIGYLWQEMLACQFLHYECYRNKIIISHQQLSSDQELPQFAYLLLFLFSLGFIHSLSFISALLSLITSSFLP